MVTRWKNSGPTRQLKLTILGDKTVGKTCLLQTYAKGYFPEGEYKSTVFPFLADEDYVYSKSVNYGGIPILLTLWDRVHSKLEDDHIRYLQCQETDVFLLCFSVVDVTTFHNVVNIWEPEIRKHNPKAPFILVGTKTDLYLNRKSLGHLCVVTRSIGIDMAERLKAVTYKECSAKTMEGVREVFVTAVQSVMNPASKKPKSCCCCPCESRLSRLVKLL